MNTIYLLLGSNVGARENNLTSARQLIAAKCGKVVATSSIYQTEAWGVIEQQAFLNQAIEIESNLQPLDLLAQTKAIEIEIGRVSTLKWGPRVIDIDILFYGDQILNLPDLIVPHPYIHARRFTLLPLHQIASNFVHPSLHQSIAELLQACTDKSDVEQLI